MHDVRLVWHTKQGQPQNQALETHPLLLPCLPACRFAGVDTTCGGQGPSCEDVKSQFFTNPQAMLVRGGKECGDGGWGGGTRGRGEGWLK